MSERKTVPVITRDNLIPPYPEYKFFVSDDAGTRVDVNDPKDGFDRATRDFRMVNAWWLADASTLVYDEPAAVEREFRAAGFTRVTLVGSAEAHLLGRNDTQCFVASNGDLVVVAFRGTETGMREPPDRDPQERRRPPDFTHIFNDIATDLDFKLVRFDDADRGKGRVHSGFKRAVDDVWEALKSQLAGLRDGRRTFWFTGHSLGAALAVLAAARAAALPDFKIHGLYTYGNPLTGDKDFVKFLDGALARHGAGYFRFVDNRDIVTTIPPEAFGYRHTGTLKHIDERGEIGGGPGVLKSIENFGRGLFRRAFDIFGTVNPPVSKLIPEQLRDHVPTLYATHIWNAHVAGS